MTETPASSTTEKKPISITVNGKQFLKLYANEFDVKTFFASLEQHATEGNDTSNITDYDYELMNIASSSTEGSCDVFEKNYRNMDNKMLSTSREYEEGLGQQFLELKKSLSIEVTEVNEEVCEELIQESASQDDEVLVVDGTVIPAASIDGLVQVYSGSTSHGSSDEQPKKDIDNEEDVPKAIELNSRSSSNTSSSNASTGSSGSRVYKIKRIGSALRKEIVAKVGSMGHKETLEQYKIKRVGSSLRKDIQKAGEAKHEKEETLMEYKVKKVGSSLRKDIQKAGEEQHEKEETLMQYKVKRVGSSLKKDIQKAGEAKHVQEETLMEYKVKKVGSSLRKEIQAKAGSRIVAQSDEEDIVEKTQSGKELSLEKALLSPVKACLQCIDEEDLNLEPSIEAVQKDGQVSLGYYRPKNRKRVEEEEEDEGFNLSVMIDGVVSQTLTLGSNAMDQLLSLVQISGATDRLAQASELGSKAVVSGSQMISSCTNKDLCGGGEDVIEEGIEVDEFVVKPESDKVEVEDKLSAAIPTARSAFNLPKSSDVSDDLPPALSAVRTSSGGSRSSTKSAESVGSNKSTRSIKSIKSALSKKSLSSIKSSLSNKSKTNKADMMELNDSSNGPQYSSEVSVPADKSDIAEARELADESTSPVDSNKVKDQVADYLGSVTESLNNVAGGLDNIVKCGENDDEQCSISTEKTTQCSVSTEKASGEAKVLDAPDSNNAISMDDRASSLVSTATLNTLDEILGGFGAASNSKAVELDERTSSLDSWFVDPTVLKEQVSKVFGYSQSVDSITGEFNPVPEDRNGPGEEREPTMDGASDREEEPASREKNAWETVTDKDLEEAKKWVAMYDKEQHDWYYYHKETRAVSWEKPKGVVEPNKETVSNASNTDSADFAKYWRSAIDAETKKLYYYNKETKEMSWTKPQCLSLLL